MAWVRVSLLILWLIKLKTVQKRSPLNLVLSVKIGQCHNIMITHPSTTNPPKVKAPTPMMAQYLQVKKNQSNALLFYRMGDFYEMFFEDAEIAAAALGIALTRRGKNNGQDIPMCGVPVHALDGYLARLIKNGHRVAICEQTEDPAMQKQRGGKGPLKREVVRVVTPGTLTEDELLPPRAHNYLAAISQAEGQIAMAWADMSTGDFAVQLCPEDGVDTMLARLDPAELIFSQDRDLPFDQTLASVCLTPQLPSLFDSVSARQALQNFYAIASLDGIGDFNRAMVSAAGALLAYIETTQIGNMPRLRTLRQITDKGLLEIDATTRRSLELTRTLTGERRGSLLNAVDRTLTAAGGRLLGERLAAPLADVAAIDARLDLVDWFRIHRQCCEDVRKQLRVQPDMQRALSRLSMGHGGPRDLAALAVGLSGAATIVTLVRMVFESGFAKVGQLDDLSVFLDQLQSPTPIANKLQPALDDDLPLLARDGGFVRQGYDLVLDEFRGLRDESRRLIAALQSHYSNETGIASLKIKHNNVLGYHIDVRASHASKLMDSSLFIHRQTTAQAVRFTTTELAELERDMASAADRAVAHELEIFDNLCNVVSNSADAIADAALAIAAIDVATAAADLAASDDYCRPVMSDDFAFEIVNGRHPVVETMLDSQSQFMPNDCDLADRQIWLLTGPNMAGKSTFLRQNAHIAIMAQAGLFVPAKSAHIGVVDRLFSRVGAADDLARGRSTFMVEMVETAAILNRATARSLVILDEIGRGTATYDGLAIAWSTLEHLHNVNKCRALFATHYHELTHLQTVLDRLHCHAVEVCEWHGSIVFLHKVIAGAADRSYGVHVARLAGLPDNVLRRAEQILTQLEAGQHGAADAALLVESLPLFDHAQESQNSGLSAVIETELAAIRPDDLTPRDAIELLYRLKAAYDDNR